MRQMLARTGTLALLAGCVTGLDGYPATLGGEDTDSAVTIVSVTPTQGPLSGGTVVTVVAEGLDWPVEAALGLTPVEVSALDATTVQFTTPAALTEAAVDLTLRTPDGEATLASAFLYLDDGSGVTVDTGGEGSDDTVLPSTGGYSGVVEIAHLQMACPTCLDGRSSDLDVQVNAVFHEPRSASWVDWIPPSGTCAFDAAPPIPSLVNRDVGATVSLTTGSESLTLQRTTLDGYGLGYASGALSTDAIPRNASWTVDLPGPGALGSVTLGGSVISGRGFDAITPTGLLINYPTSDLFSQPITQSGQTFTWAPTGPDLFVIEVHAFDGSTGAYLGSVACAGPDNGSMVVPATYLAAYPAYASVLVTLSRYRLSTATVPGEDSVVEGVSWFGFEGTGYLQP